MSALIYLDHNATTPLDDHVLERMLPWLTDRFWNAASSHSGGQVAASAVEAARDAMAGLIGARAGEIVWTSGATEADNLALKGVLEMAAHGRRRLVTVATEHKAVLDTAGWLASHGSPVTVLPVGSDGSLDVEQLSDTLAGDDVALVSVMAANNETGVIADLATISAVAHERGALVHTDATQAVGKVAFNVSQLEVDLASMSAHKIYGPKGVGALFVSRRVAVAATMHGGGHERGMRSGTLNVPGIVGMGEAAQICLRTSDDEARRQAGLRSLLVRELQKRLLDVVETTTVPQRLSNTASLRFVGADAEAVMVNAPEVAVSAGSACTALVPSPSHVLLAMGLGPSAASECLRFSLGRSTTEADIEAAVTSVERAVTRVRELVLDGTGCSS